MKKMLMLAAVAMPLLGLTDEVDGITAVVGTETILKSDVITEMVRLQLPASSYNDVRSELIDRKLILKASVEAKMAMQEWVVESRIREIIERAFEGDRNKLMETLTQQKIAYPEWKQRMKDDMIISAMRWNVVDKNAHARPADMLKHYQSHPELYSTQPKVTVSVIMLKPEERDLRDSVASALVTKDFAAVAKEFSCDMHAAEGGVWKDIDPKEVFKPEVSEEIALMPIHTLSRWIEIDGWSFLLRKDAEELGETIAFEDAYDQIEANVKAEESKKAYDAWIERLRSETYIKVY